MLTCPTCVTDTHVPHTCYHTHVCTFVTLSGVLSGSIGWIARGGLSGSSGWINIGGLSGCSAQYEL